MLNSKTPKKAEQAIRFAGNSQLRDRIVAKHLLTMKKSDGLEQKCLTTLQNTFLLSITLLWADRFFDDELLHDTIGQVSTATTLRSPFGL